jgi:hypothetical protein
MNDIWLRDPKKWKSFSLIDRLNALHTCYCTGPCGQSASVLAARDELSRCVIEALAGLSESTQFRDEVLAALLECQSYDALYDRLMELIERTAKNAND